MAKKYHPDVSEGCAEYAHEKMQKINEVYGILSNNALREEYDYQLWADEREGKKAHYDNEFRDFVPQGSRMNPGVQKSSWEKFYGDRPKPEGIFGRSQKKPKSGKARKIMALVWALRIGIPAVLFLVILSVVAGLPFSGDWIDNNVYRGSPSRITRGYIQSIRDFNFDRSLRLSTGSGERMTRQIRNTYMFRSDDIPYGEIWLEQATQNLSFKLRRTERAGFDSASATLEITNINAEAIFAQAQQAIRHDLDHGTPRPILRQAIADQDLLLVREVYEFYIAEAAKETSVKLTATIRLSFYRGGSLWQISGADDIALLKNVILGGFGDVDFSEYLPIDWYRELGLSREDE
jgi:curved DNA-binding protein CbpA